MTKEETEAADYMELFVMKYGALLDMKFRNGFCDDVKELIARFTKAGVAIQDESYKDAFKQVFTKT